MHLSATFRNFWLYHLQSPDAATDGDCHIRNDYDFSKAQLPRWMVNLWNLNRDGNTPKEIDELAWGEPFASWYPFLGRPKSFFARVTDPGGGQTKKLDNLMPTIDTRVIVDLQAAAGWTNKYHGQVCESVADADGGDAITDFDFTVAVIGHEHEFPVDKVVKTSLSTIHDATSANWAHNSLKTMSKGIIKRDHSVNLPAAIYNALNAIAESKRN
ncbi:hypothetical protein BCR34DRAFT_589446 [Clohesyomyces aquaticus]|uniref:Uncharacterized protein n=1 Tax=Clohesyomyces aquaticus TaxID=1231657 RepID=A0A1Y1ZG21_9PLEO|nr:hypothetical protein BCR34DRAFT_589446 [Clohesyomyces aquaticus]